MHSIMHLALLGAVKRLILFWKEFHIDYLQCSDHKSLTKLEEIVGLLRTESMRQLRGFDEVKKWKETKLQQ